MRVQRPETVALFTATLLVAAGLGGGDAAVAQAQAQAPEPAAAPLVLDCLSFPKTIDEAALVKRFGRANVVAADLDGAEGSTERGTVVYPKDPAKRLEIYWFDPNKKRKLSSIAIRGRSEWTMRTPGKTRSSVGLKTTLDEMEEANERPFLINGFGWDMGGFGAGWKGGKLDALEGGCFLSARFDPDPKAKDKALSKVSGDRKIGSSDAALRAVKPTLSSISLEWPE